MRPSGGALLVSRALPMRDTGASGDDVSLSNLARAALALPTPRGASTEETHELFGEREARADLARALATLAEPARALATFTTSELARGAGLLRMRVLRGVFSGAREQGRSQAQELSEGLASLGRRDRYGSSASWAARAATAPEASFRAFVLLTRSDRTLLSLLYASAQSHGTDLGAVDDVARALLVLRQREQAASTARASGNSLLPASQPTLPELRALIAPDSLPPSTEPERDDESSAQAPWLARSDSYAPRGFGSSSQFAAHVVSSYRSLLPPAPPPSMAPPPREVEDTPVEPAVALARPFNPAEALGLSTLVLSLNKKVLSARRMPRKNQGKGDRVDARMRDSRDVDPDASPGARRRARWQELFRRRRALRRTRSSR